MVPAPWQSGRMIGFLQGGIVTQDYSGKKPRFILCYVGLGCYLAWMFLSFNSSTLTGQDESSTTVLLVHIVSSIAAAVSFVLLIILYPKVLLLKVRSIGIGLVALGSISGLGTLLYTLPLFSHAMPTMIAGAIVSGLTGAFVVPFLGIVFQQLSARKAAIGTAVAFLLAAAIYLLVTNLNPVFAAIAVSLLPLGAAVSVASVLSLKDSAGNKVGFLPSNRAGVSSEGLSWAGELRTLLRTVLSWRILLGIVSAMFVCGGLRVYMGDITPSLYQQPLLMTMSIGISAALFLVYGLFISRTSLNLGILYRIALPVLAVAFMMIALFNGENASQVFFLVSTCSVLFEVLTWVLLVEIARTTHFSALLIFSVGRLAVHIGIGAGELVASAMLSNLIPFSVLAVCLLAVSTGFTFTDKETTFLFEPPTSEELVALTASTKTVGGAPESSYQLPKTVSEGSPLLQENLLLRITLVAETYSLSPREEEVFALWVTGHGSRYIQEELVITEATVKSHVRHIYEKCSVHNRAELMKKLEEASA